MHIKKLLAGAALLVASVTVNATIITTIDDFSTDQGPLSTSISNPAYSAVTGSGIIGGVRELFLQTFSTTNVLGASAIQTIGGDFFLTSTIGTESQFTIQWDGVDSSNVGTTLADKIAVDTYGLGGYDFSTTDFSFVTNIVQSDLNAWFDVTFWSGDNGSIVETINLPIPSVSTQRDALFSAGLFTLTQFDNVGAIRVRGNTISPETGLRQNSYDLQLSSVVAVSEPGTLGALAAGVFGLLLTRRRV